MKLNKLLTSGLAVALSAGALTTTAHAANGFDYLADAVTSGKAYGDFRLRYEGVEQDNPARNADALTLRSRLGYTTGSYKGLYGTLEVEDSRIVAGAGNFAVPLTDYQKDEFSVIADPETTELDQAFIGYKSGDFSFKLGRQVYTLDGQRFVGHVGLRQDRQTFDAATFKYSPLKSLDINFAFIDQRNRIFAEAVDVDSEDTLLNLSYKSPFGKLTGYGYLLKVDSSKIDTYGISLKGTKPVEDIKLSYALEFATQETNADQEATYMFAEGGVTYSGITAQIGYEVLGSDEGNYIFSTPLATFHKFNGWADMFIVGPPPTGLQDTYLSLATKIKGAKVALTYHDYSADEGDAEHGSEINAVVGKTFSKNYNAGIKYASYSSDDFKVDTDKIWAWVGMKF